jgi:hypothetical protein
VTDSFFRYSPCIARKVRCCSRYLTTSLGHDDNPTSLESCGPSSSRALTVKRSYTATLECQCWPLTIVCCRSVNTRLHCLIQGIVVKMSRSRVALGLASFLLLATTESFVVRPSPPSNVFTTSLQMGLFDGVKDAFSAPALERSILDAERETPIDRWMGWSVASENNRESKGQAMGTCGMRKALVTSLTRKAAFHVTHLKIPRLLPFVDQNRPQLRIS